MLKFLTTAIGPSGKLNFGLSIVSYTSCNSGGQSLIILQSLVNLGQLLTDISYYSSVINSGQLLSYGMSDYLTQI